jgi:hypothetical protein
VEALKKRVASIEKSKIPDDKLFFSGQFYDAFSFLTDLVASADKSICLVDPYCDSKALNVLAKKKRERYPPNRFLAFGEADGGRHRPI